MGRKSTFGIAAAIIAAILLIVSLRSWSATARSRAAEQKIDTLRRHLYVGESRKDIEREFGRSIPTPYSTGSWTATHEKGVHRWYDHLREYTYRAPASSGWGIPYWGLVV